MQFVFRINNAILITQSYKNPIMGIKLRDNFLLFGHVVVASLLGWLLAEQLIQLHNNDRVATLIRNLIRFVINHMIIHILYFFVNR